MFELATDSSRVAPNVSDEQLERDGAVLSATSDHCLSSEGFDDQ